MDEATLKALILYEGKIETFFNNFKQAEEMRKEELKN